MSGWIDRQIGFDLDATVPIATTIEAVHQTGAGGRYGPSSSHHGLGHGHSHGKQADHGHGHNHGGGDCCGSEQAPANDYLTVETACGSGDLAAVILFWAQGEDVAHRRVPMGETVATPFMWAAFKGHIPVMKFLLDKGADIHAATEDGQNSLMWAVADGRCEVVDMLLKLGARPSDCDTRGYNAYFVAVQSSNLAVLSLLTDHQPIDPLQRDAEGHTLLHWAAYRGSIALCRYLHEVLGVPVDLQDHMKRTPLIWAAREGFEDVCAYLLSKGARSTVTDVEECTALQYATERRQRHVVAVLQQNATQVTSRRCVGTFALMLADRAMLLSGLMGVCYTISAFVASHFLPAIFSHFIIGLFMMKNLLWAYLLKIPPTHKSQTATDGNQLRKVIAAAGIPSNLAQSVRCLDYISRFREPATLFAVLAFLAVQHISLLTAALELNMVYWALLSVSLAALWYTKSVALQNVIPGAAIQDHPSVRAARERKFKLLQTRTIDQEKMVRVPLRAFYCYEIDEVVKQYNGFSVVADCPIGENNLTSFFYFVVAFTLMQAHVCIVSWQSLQAKLCSTEPPLSGPLYGFVIHALPCAIKPVDESWAAFLMPSALNTSGVWIIQLSLTAALMGAVVTLRILSSITKGCTRKELVNPTAPTADGDMVSIFRNHGTSGRQSVFSEGGPLSNAMALLLGRFGQRWRGIYAVPAPPSV